MRTGASPEKLRILDNIPSPFIKHKLVAVETYSANSTTTADSTVSAITEIPNPAVAANANTTNDSVDLTMSDANDIPLLEPTTDIHDLTDDDTHSNAVINKNASAEQSTVHPTAAATKSKRTPSTKSKDRRSSSHPPQRVIKYDRDMTQEEFTRFAQRFPGQELWKDSPQEQYWVKSILKIIRSLSKTKAAQPFLSPVDWVAFNIPDYPTIIKHPMDLKTIDDKLVNGQYTNPEDCISDVRLVFSNAFIYNSAEHYVTQCAKELSIKFETALYQL
jgi:hypothetical protein